MFTACVRQFPFNNALHIDGGFITYAGLWTLVKRVYAQIPAEPVYSRIGIYCRNDAYTYAAMIAVNLYGAAYIPLNVGFPAERNKQIVKESGMELLISSTGNPFLHKLSADVPLLIVGENSPADVSTIETVSVNTKNTVWYILFTSGSTGLPKGVPVTADNTRSFFNYYLSNYDFNPSDRFLQVYELSFDVSVFSFFMPLLVGACCYVLPDEGVRVVKIIDCLKEHRITVLSMVPTVLNYLERFLPEIHLPHLRYSFFSGDALYHRLAVQWSASVPNAAIHNFYGPTETTIVCTRYIFDERRSTEESVNGIVPLGKPFEGMDYIIIDNEKKPAEKGELCFAGTQVIPGYLKGLYEENFFEHNGKRYYRTGDIASLNMYGNLVFHGRTDEQVKISGYRVELKEIEAAIEKESGIACKALVIKDSKQNNRLVIFMETQQVDREKLMDALSQRLPHYMLPQEIHAVPAFPLSINGKIDKEKLLQLQV